METLFCFMFFFGRKKEEVKLPSHSARDENFKDLMTVTSTLRRRFSISGSFSTNDLQVELNVFMSDNFG